MLPDYVGVHVGDEVVCLTEGVMKSDLAYSFAQGSLMSVVLWALQAYRAILSTNEPLKN